MHPLVSVLIPVYNAEATLLNAIESIRRQSLREIEIVVVDDGSTDSTPQLLEQLSQKDQRIRVQHVPHGGIIRALNSGIEECRAGLIARMDADDISHRRRLELQVNYMTAHPEISVCSSRIAMFPRNQVLGGMARYREWLNSILTHEDTVRNIFVKSPIVHPSVMLRKDELISVGSYQEHGWAEDYDLWLRYHAAGKRFAKLENTLLFWRQCAGRLTFSDSRYSVENFLRAKSHYLGKILRNSERPILLWGAGKTGRRILKHLRREGLNIQAVIDVDRLKIGSTLRALPIVPPEYIEEQKNAFVISAVSSHGARELIREFLICRGFAEMRDFICAA